MIDWLERHNSEKNLCVPKENLDIVFWCLCAVFFQILLSVLQLKLGCLHPLEFNKTFLKKGKFFITLPPQLAVQWRRFNSYWGAFPKGKYFRLPILFQV